MFLLMTFVIVLTKIVIEDININCLLYADDLLIISESEEGLQNCISILEQYCNR